MASSEMTAFTQNRVFSRGKWVLLLLLMAVVLVIAWRTLGSVAVVVAPPTRGSAVQAVYATGSVESSVTVRIAPQVAGRLLELRSDEGASVNAGQILARLDDSDLQASLRDERARLRLAEARLGRFQTLFKTGFATRDQIEEAHANRDSALATTQRLMEQIKFTTLRASVPGRIIRRDGEVGDFIPVNQPVFYLAQTGVPLRISADVDEEDIASVRSGQRVLITADAFPGRVFEGQVAEITPKGDPLARNYRVRIALPSGTPLMIGMTTEANIILAQHENALLVPTSAVNGSKVWLAREGRAVLQPVTLGVRGLNRTEVVAGLREGDEIIVQPPADLKEGAKVHETRSASKPSNSSR